MAALTAARNTPRMVSPHDQVRSYKMKASTTIFQGGLCMVDAGFLQPFAITTTGIAVGRARKTVTNSGANGAISAEVEEGVFKVLALGADPPVQADVGKDVFMTTDQEVSKTNATSTKSRAGALVQVDSDGVWVQVGLGL